MTDSRNNYINNIIAIILLFVGMYFPTSYKEQISNNLLLTQYIIIIMTYFIIIKRSRKLNNHNIMLAILIHISLLYSTFFSINYMNIKDVTYGAYIQFIAISLMYIVELKEVKCSKIIEYIFLIINILNLVLAMFIVFNNYVVIQFFKDNYSIFYEDLLMYQFAKNKPILTFGTHSVASFYMFIFFILNYFTYKYKKNKLFLIVAISNIIIMFLTKSNTSYIYVILSILLILKESNIKSKVYIILGIGFVIGVFFRTEIFKEYVDIILENLNSTNNGFKSRYFGSDLFKSNINYIVDNFFIPIGVACKSDLYYTDNGFIVYMLRGGIILVISIYYGLYNFLKRNILNSKYMIYVFISLIIFEMVFNNFNFIRTFYLIPFTIIYLNYIEYEYKMKKVINNVV